MSTNNYNITTEEVKRLNFRFCAVPKELRKMEFKIGDTTRRLSNPEVCVYSEILDTIKLSSDSEFFLKDGIPFVGKSYETIAETLNISQASVYRACSVLDKVGLIHKEKGGPNRPNRTFITHKDFLFSITSKSESPAQSSQRNKHSDESDNSTVTSPITSDCSPNDTKCIDTQLSDTQESKDNRPNFDSEPEITKTFKTHKWSNDLAVNQVEILADSIPVWLRSIGVETSPDIGSESTVSSFISLIGKTIASDEVTCLSVHSVALQIGMAALAVVDKQGNPHKRINSTYLLNQNVIKLALSRTGEYTDSEVYSESYRRSLEVASI